MYINEFLTAILVVSKAILSFYEMRRKFPNIVCPGCCTFWNFSIFGSIIGCVCMCPKDTLCDKSFKSSVETIRREIEE